MTPENKDVAGSLPSSEGAVFQRQDDLDGKRWLDIDEREYNRVGTAWRRIVYLAAPGAAIDAREHGALHLREGEPLPPPGKRVPQCEDCGGCREWGGNGLWHHFGCPTKEGAVWLQTASREEAPVANAQDAQRYRLLRRGQHWSVYDGGGEVLRAEALDAAIDAIAAPSEALSPATVEQPVAEIVTFGYLDGQKEVSWSKGKMPPVGTKLYAQPCASQGCGGAVEDCAVDVYSSRMCERGTKGCTVSHAALSTAKSVEHDATPTE